MSSLKKTQITLRLKEDLANKISEKAGEYGISVNAYISMVLSKELSEKKKQ